MDTNKMDTGKIRRFLRRIYPLVLSDKDKECGIFKIIPLAFPLILSTWKIKLKISEPAGLVERHILQALRDFGPCTIETLDELLCLGVDRLKIAIDDMISLGASISFDGTLYSFSSTETIEEFSHTSIHNFKFILNGITGKLLPIRFGAHLEAISISTIDSDDYLPYRVFRPILSGFESTDLKSIREGNIVNVSSSGIPEGFVCFEGNSPISESQRYILAFMFCFTDKTTKTVSAEDMYELLPNNDYLERQPQIERVLRSSPVIPKACDGFTLNGYNPATAEIKILVDDLLSWRRNVQFENKQAFEFINDFVKNGWTWNPSLNDNSFFLFRPGDEKTTHALFIARAALKIQRDYSSWNVPGAFFSWYDNFYNEFTNIYPALSSCPPSNEFLSYILQTTDNGDLKDFVQNLIRSDAIGVKSNGAEKIEFFSSLENFWEKRLMASFDEARQSIQIISPVIEDDEVFAKLEQANARGVYLQIITPLTESSRSNTFRSDPLFSHYELPRQKLAKLGASVRAMKSTAHAKILIIDGYKLYFLSANLNPNSLGHGDRNAIECCLLVENHPLVKSVISAFNAMWENAQYSQVKIGTHTEISDLTDEDFVPSRSNIKAGGLDLIVSTPGNLSLANRISKMIDNAKKDVVLMALSCYDLSAVPVVFNSMKKALKRGIRITAVLRTGIEQFTPEQWPDESTRMLMAAGMTIVEVPCLHAKCVVTDSDDVLLMSANLNQYSLGDWGTSHIEMGVYLSGQKTVALRSRVLSFVSQYLDIPVS